MKKYKNIVTHQRPHFDEIVSVWLLRRFAQEIFDLSSAVWVEMPSNQLPKSWKQLLDRMFVGCAGSPYDEHGTDADSSAQLVAEDILSFQDGKILSRLINLVGQYDRNTVPVKDSLPSMTKALFQTGKTVEEVYKWVKVFLSKLYDSEKEIHEKIDREVEALGLLDPAAKLAEKFLRAKRAPRVWNQLAFTDCCAFVNDKAWEKTGREALAARQERFNEALAMIEGTPSQTFKSVIGELNILAVQTDNDQVSPASRYIGIDICVIKNSNGNVQVLTNQKKGIRLFKAAAMIRKAERKARGKDIRISFAHLMSEGTIPECPEWHVHEGINGANLYNGTGSYEAIEPTKLPLEEIVAIIIRSLVPRGMEQNADRDLGYNSLAQAFAS